MPGSRARDQSMNRRWTRTTPYTYMLSARIPIEIADRLRAVVDSTARSTTEVVIEALTEYLEKRGA